VKFRVLSLEFRVGRADTRRHPSAFQPSAFNLQLAPGFTLIECLAYVGLFALFIVLVMTTFFRTREGADSLRRNADDITRALHAGERWREDVRTATAPPSLVTENGQTWLALPHGTNTTVYTHFQNTVWRQEHTNQTWQPVLTRVTSSHMEADARQHVAAWRWEVELQTKDEMKRTKPSFTFLAVAPKETKP
jgi:type II secretory pathway pseudopilin PulG